MPKIVKKYSKNFTITSNQVARDSRLTWEARGVFQYLWSQADTWQFRAKEVATHSPQGIDKLNKCLNELEKYGYLERKRDRESGMLRGSTWSLCDSPKLDFPIQAKPVQAKPIQANPRLRSTNQKKEQYKEVSRERKDSPAKAEPPIYKEVIDCLNAKAGTKYKSSSAINKRLIDARIKDGYSLDDFKTVIKNKCATWLHDSKMSKYLRPQTLFGTKFEGYLNEKMPGISEEHSMDPRMLAQVSDVDKDDLPF